MNKSAMNKSAWLFFPDYRASNPYQALLAAALAPAFDVRSGSVQQALQATGAGDVVFHLHWEDAVYATATTRADAQARIAAFLRALDALQARGGRIVWTVHNAAPHEDRHSDLSAEFRGALAARADLVHVHGVVAGDMLRVAGAAPDKILVLHHPHFRDAYPDDITDAAARRYFGVQPHETVFAFLGAMRGYKGLDTLLTAFTDIHASRPACLILAGRPPGPDDAAILAASVARLGAGLRLLPRFVEDCTVQYVMRAADYVVLPYRAILTSGAMALALGFGRPVIVPALPALTELLHPGEDSLIFRPGDAADLARTMRAACDLDADQRGRMKRRAGLTADAATFAQLARAMIWWERMAREAPRPEPVLRTA